MLLSREGIEPVNELLPKFNVCKAEKDERPEGIEPTKLLFSKSKTIRLLAEVNDSVPV